VNKEGEILSYPIKIRRELWEEWKKTIPREINLNEAVVNLIEQDVERNHRTEK